VMFHAGGGSFKSQLKRADGSGAAVCIIVGEEEAQAKQVSCKPLRGQGEQQTLSVEMMLSQIASWIPSRSR
jgi:histidyl-tRNA synthetase